MNVMPTVEESIKYGQEAWETFKKVPEFEKIKEESAVELMREFIEEFPQHTQEMHKEANFETIIQTVIDLQTLLLESNFISKYVSTMGYDSELAFTLENLTDIFIEDLQEVLKKGVEVFLAESELTNELAFKKFGIDSDVSGMQIYEVFIKFPLAFIQRSEI